MSLFTIITSSAIATSSSKMGEQMKAVHYEGPFKVSVKEIDLPKIQHPDDALIKVTTACGHLFPINLDPSSC